MTKLKRCIWNSFIVGFCYFYVHGKAIGAPAGLDLWLQGSSDYKFAGLVNQGRGSQKTLPLPPDCQLF